MPNENFDSKLETWAGETHNTDESRKILVCEKKIKLADPVSKKMYMCT